MKRSVCHLPAVRTLTLAALLGLGTARTALHAQKAYTWSGGGGSANANVDNPNNWQGNAAPPTNNSSASVLFSDAAFGAGAPSLGVNLNVNFLINSLSFAGSSTFTLGSTNANIRGLNIGAGGLIQSSTAVQAVAVPTFLTADQTWSFADGAGALNFTYTGTGSQINNLGHTLTLNPTGTNTLNGAMSGAGAVTINGSGTQILTGNNTYTGGTSFVGGVLQAGSKGALGSSGTLSFNGGALQYSAANTTDYSGRFSQAANQAYAVDTNAQNVTLATALTSSGGSFTKLGAGTLTLTGNNTYTGATTISAGTLQVGNGDTSGSLGTNTGTITDNGTLAFNRSDNLTLANAVSGSGGLTQLGTGTLILGAASTYTGVTTVAGNTLQVGDGGSLSGTSQLYVAQQYIPPAGGSKGHYVNGTLNISGTGSIQIGTPPAKDPAIAVAGGSIVQSGGVVSSNGGWMVVGYLNSGAYTLSGDRSVLSTGVTWLGSAFGFSTFNQSGGSFTTNGQPLSLRFNATYTLSGGSLSTGEADVGTNRHSDLFNQSGGSFTTNGNLLALGTAIDSEEPDSVQGTYTLSGTGSLSTGAMIVGQGAVAAFVQSGGTASTNGGTLTLGQTNTGAGSYALSGGSLNAGLAYIGNSGAGTFSQSGGTFSNGSNGLYLGFNAGSGGTYTLSGGNLSTGTAIIGFHGTGAFNQSGGSFDTGGSTLVVGGYNAGSYILSDTGSLSTGAVTIGLNGTAFFNQSGGSFSTNGRAVSLGAYAGSDGAYNLDGGTLSTGAIGGSAGTSTFNFNGGTLQVTAKDVSVGNGPFLAGLTAANVRNGGAVIDTNGTNATVAQGLVHSTLGSLDGALVVTNGGSEYYDSPPTVTISGGGGHGATAVATINDTGQITGVMITNAGTNYTSAPTITFSGDGGSGAMVSNPFISDNATDGGLTKLGAGTLTLTGNNTYTGPTTVNAGTLLVNGTNRGMGMVTVTNSGSVLGGTGTLTGMVKVTGGAAINPGNNVGAVGAASVVGTLNVGALTLSSGTSAIFDVNSATLYDRLVVGGSVDLGGASFVFNGNPNATFGAGATLDLVHLNSGTLTGAFAGISDGGIYTFDNQAFQAVYTPTDFELVAVPEPATWAGGVLLLTSAGLILRRLRSA